MKDGRHVHNHTVNAGTFSAYPTSRGIVNPVNQLAVSTMVESGAPRSRIYDFLLSKGENVVRRDVDNMVSRGTHRVTTQEDDEKTASVLVRFRAEDSANVVTIDETAAGESGVISISTRMMRECFVRFPETLMVDCTHKTNR